MERWENDPLDGCPGPFRPEDPDYSRVALWLTDIAFTALALAGVLMLWVALD